MTAQNDKSIPFDGEIKAGIPNTADDKVYNLPPNNNTSIEPITLQPLAIKRGFFCRDCQTKQTWLCDSCDYSGKKSAPCD